MPPQQEPMPPNKSRKGSNDIDKQNEHEFRYKSGRKYTKILSLAHLTVRKWKSTSQGVELSTEQKYDILTPLPPRRAPYAYDITFQVSHLHR